MMKPVVDWPSELRLLIDSILGEESSLFRASAFSTAPPTFRFNRLKHTRTFQEEILALEDYCYESSPLPDAQQVTVQPQPIGKSFSHFLGHIYIQDLASMLPPLILKPRPGDCVLDLCAAPGSKTTQLAAIMGNSGAIIANDVTTRRIKSLAFNLRRTGVANTAVTKFFGQQMGNLYYEHFDRVLLDAPCSALGTVGKSPRVPTWWTPARSQRLAANQRQLLQSGLKALRPGGVLVYSTCTIVPEENEQVIAYALRNFPVTLEEISLEGLKARPGLAEPCSGVFCRDLEKAVRLYPFENPCQGFFIARLRKTDSFGTPRYRRAITQIQPYCASNEPEVLDRLGRLLDHFEIPSTALDQGLIWKDAGLSWSSHQLAKLPFFASPVIAGLPIAHTGAHSTKLTTEGSHLFGGLARKNVVSLQDVTELEDYLHRNPIRRELPSSQQVLVSFKNSVIGHAIVDRAQILSRIPRVGWHFHLNRSKSGMPCPQSRHPLSKSPASGEPAEFRGSCED